MTVKEIAALITAPTEIMDTDGDGLSRVLYSIYSPSDIDNIPADIAIMEVQSIDHGREAIVLNI